MAKPSKTTEGGTYGINSKQSAEQIKADLEKTLKKFPKAEFDISIVRNNTPKSLLKSKGGK